MPEDPRPTVLGSLLVGCIGERFTLGREGTAAVVRCGQGACHFDGEPDYEKGQGRKEGR